jgi:hypothetical protein
MKTVNTKQRGFFDPVTGLVLLSIFGLTGAALESVHPASPADATKTQHQVACAETGTTIVGEDFHCN